MRSNTASLPGSKTEYVISDKAKRYTMRDNAFTETKNGNFQYERTLSTVPSDKNAPKLKITVNKEFTKLKISTVTANGLKKIDLYKNDAHETAREFAENILENFINENVLEKA